MTKARVFIIAGLIIAGIGSLTYFFADDLGLFEIPLAALQEKYEKPQSRYIRIDGTEVHYCDEGSGPVIVALHGIMDSLHTWDGWVHEIGDRCRIIRLDLPGFGLTGPFARGDYSREAYVRFLDRFVTSLGLSRFTLAGNSLGGAIAWNYALEFPDKVAAMILIDPAGYPLDIPYPLRLAAIPVIRDAVLWMTPRFIFRMSVKQVLGDHRKLTDDLVDRFYELSLRPGNREALPVIMDVLTALNNDPAFSARISGIKVPTLLLWGEKDHWIPVSQVEQWCRDLPEIHAIIYSGVGHVPQMEIPEQSAADVHKWLAVQAAAEKEPFSRAVMWRMALAIGIVSAASASGFAVYRRRKRRA
ncbi:MAG: alpha/beta fold hydrolase [Thermodesulfobacteriota bacterium]